MQKSSRSESTVLYFFRLYIRITMPIANWGRNDELAEKIIDQEDVKGWYNEEADEAVVRASDGIYVAYWYPRPEYSSRRMGGRKGRVLFRDSAKQRIDSRIAEQLRKYPAGVDNEEVRRSQLDVPKDLEDWAHAYGAAYTITEKIGNCKQSGGDVAIFEGSSRRGEGAYVALAYEDGPRGKDYVSVGRESNGFYNVNLSGMSRPSRGAIEIMEPKSVDFFGNGKIHVIGSDDKRMSIVPTTKGTDTEAWKDMF